jgi:putative ABC transport system permease protein
MRPRWRKVISDLFDNKARTAMVVLSIAVGVFSIGVIAGAYQIISNDMSVSYAANRPGNIEFRMGNFNDDVLSTVSNAKGVLDAEGYRVVNFRIRTLDSDKWVSIDVVAINDFATNNINLLTSIEGKAVAGKDEVLLEKDTLKHLDVKIGDKLAFEMPDGSIKTLPVVGIVQSASTGAGDFLAPPFAYVTLSTMPTLRQPELYNRAYAIVSEGQDDMLHIHEVGAELKDKLEKNGYPVIRTRFSETHKHPLADTVNAILGILMALGILILFLSSSLIANTLSALLNQHTRHIGVIKLVGGNSRQVLAMYLALIMAFAVLALLIAVPLGGQGAYALALFIATKIRFTLLGYRIVPMALLIQILVGVLVPLLAGLVPVLSGSRVTVLQAIAGDAGRETGSSHKGSPHRGVTRWEWIQTRATILLAKRGIHIPRPFVISLRNTFRRRGRLILTLFTLTMGGAIFIAVFNVRVTLHDYIGAIGQYFRADVQIDFDVPYRLRELEQFAMQVPGVDTVEGWQFIGTDLLAQDGSVLESVNVLAPPADSPLIKPILDSGRWIRSTDVRQMAVSDAVKKYYPNLQPGEYLPLKVDGRTEQWEVIGIFKFVGREGILAYVPMEYAATITGLVNQSYSVRIMTDRHDRATQDMMAQKLDLYFRENGFKVRSSQSGLASLDTASESLDTLVIFLLIMAVLTAIVGSMGLTGTMSMNVLERTREIGITRAIGADDRAVMRTVIAEGVVIGMISFALAILLSIPFTYLLSTIVSLAVFETPIATHFTVEGYAIWLGLVLVLSAVASILPARNAATLTIREVLAYE